MNLIIFRQSRLYITTTRGGGFKVYNKTTQQPVSVQIKMVAIFEPKLKISTFAMHIYETLI